MTLPGSTVLGQDDQCDIYKKLIKNYEEKISELENKLKAEAGSYEQKAGELTEQLKTHERKIGELTKRLTKDSTELQKTKNLLETERNDPKKEQIKQQSKRIKQLQSDSAAMSKNLSAIIAERDRLRSAETERNNIKASYDSAVVELNSLRLQNEKFRDSLTTDRDSLATVRDSHTTELSKIRTQWESDTTNLNRRLDKLETERNKTRTSFDSIDRILRHKLIVENAEDLLNRAYNKTEIDKSIVALDATLLTIPESSPSCGEAKKYKDILSKYSGKWKQFRDIINDIVAIDGKNREITSMTLKAEHLNNVFSWIKSNRHNAFEDFRDYPFLLKKLQELTVIKIEDSTRDFPDIRKIFDE
jgi:DNA repair exonuclease SbcCD ATPase subunit